MPHRIAVNHWSWRMCILKGPISNAFACRSFLLFMLRHPSLILHFRPPLTWGRHMWVRSLCIKFWNEVIPSAWHERGQHRGEKGTFLFCHLSPQRILGMLYLLFLLEWTVHMLPSGYPCFVFLFSESWKASHPCVHPGWFIGRPYSSRYLVLVF